MSYIYVHFDFICPYMSSHNQQFLIMQKAFCYLLPSDMTGSVKVLDCFNVLFRKSFFMILKAVRKFLLLN